MTVVDRHHLRHRRAEPQGDRGTTAILVVQGDHGDRSSLCRGTTRSWWKVPVVPGVGRRYIPTGIGHFLSVCLEDFTRYYSNRGVSFSFRRVPSGDRRAIHPSQRVPDRETSQGGGWGMRLVAVTSCGAADRPIGSASAHAATPGSLAGLPLSDGVGWVKVTVCRHRYFVRRRRHVRQQDSSRDYQE